MQQILALDTSISIEQAVRLAITNVKLEGFTDVFERPFERDFLEVPEFVAAVAQTVSTAIMARTYEHLEFRPIYYTLQPKSRRVYEFRRVALIEPIDTIKYLALAILCAPQIERFRIPSEQRCVYSYRFRPQSDGALWDPAFSVQSFYENSQNLAHTDNVQVVVHCDIANFYDRLNLHRLESTLQDLGLDPWLVKCLNDLLLSWSKRDPYGLPVGSNASRILAEAALIEVDRYLIAEGVTFCRYVDDYRMFAPNVHTAQSWLCRLLNRLSSEGLTLNASKTRVRPSRTPEGTAIADLPEGATQDDGKKRSFVPKLGYGRIPRRFLAPTEAALEELKNLTHSAADLLGDILSQTVVDATNFELFMRLVVAKEEFDTLSSAPELLRRCPPFIEYVVDALIKYRERAGEATRARIAIEMGSLLTDLDLPEWHAVQVIRLISLDEYANPGALRRLRKSLKRDSGIYLTRILTEGLEAHSTRGDQYELKNIFERADPWERRALLRTLKKILPEEEHNAWVRSVFPQIKHDPFAVQIVRPYESRRKSKAT